MKPLYTLQLVLAVNLAGAQQPKKPKPHNPALATTPATGAAIDPSGHWHGTITAQDGSTNKVLYHIQKKDTGYLAAIHIPTVGIRHLAATHTSFQNPQLKIRFDLKPSSKDQPEYIKYQGQLRHGKLVGTLTMPTHTYPLALSRGPTQASHHPQQPAPSLPYHTEEILFQNPQDHTALAGSLVLPQKAERCPAVLLLSNLPLGRDEVRDGHKTFLTLAQHLAKNGIASLRFDYRAAAELAPNKPYQDAYQLPIGDAKSAFAYLRTRPEIDKNKIGLLEHGIGSYIAPPAAAEAEDAAFLIILGGVGLSGYPFLIDITQAAKKLTNSRNPGLDEQEKRVMSAIYQAIKEATSQQQVEKDLQTLFKKVYSTIPEEYLKSMGEGMTHEKLIATSVQPYADPVLQPFIKLDPTPALTRVRCPVLALSGEKDLEAPPKNNLPAIAQALARGGNNKVTVKTMPGLNHLFQPCQIGLPSEYANIEQTFSPEALEEISSWIAAQTQ